MGGRFLCHAMHKAAHLFTEAVEPHGSDSRDIVAMTASARARIELASMTFLHPEADLDRFKMKDFVCLRRVCSLITLYTDQHDPAVASAEYVLFRCKWVMALTGGPCGCRTDFPKYRSLGLHPHDVRKPTDLQALDLDVIDISWMD